MNVRRTVHRVCRGLLWLSCVGGGASVQAITTDDPITYVRHELEGWVFAPAVQDEQVIGFLAWLLPGEGVSGNLKIVWSERLTNGHWAQYAWPDGDFHDAVSWLRALYADGMLLAQDPTISEAIAPGIAGGDSVPAYMEYGLNCNDPYQMIIVGSQSPTTLLDLLQAQGWEVAPWISQQSALTSGPCYGGGVGNAMEGVLNGLAEETEIDLFGVSTLAHGGCAWPCKCKTEYGGSTATGTGAWSLTGTTIVAGRKKCSYERPATASYRKTGRHWYCVSCDSTGVHTGRETGMEDVLATDPCPSGPSHWTFVP